MAANVMPRPVRVRLWDKNWKLLWDSGPRTPRSARRRRCKLRRKRINRKRNR